MDDLRTYTAYQLESPVSSPPQRVVSLVPSMTESLFDLNLGSRIIGITDYCIYPKDGVANLPRLGGTKNPDVQKIIELQADLVLMNEEENRPADIEALKNAGVPVWVTFPKTVRESLNLLWSLMYIFDEPSMVPRVRLIEQTVDWVERISETRESPCRVFVPIWHDPLMTFNADTYCHDLLRVCGGINIFAERKRMYPLKADLGQAEPYAENDPRLEGLDTRYPRVTLDEVAAAKPDMILLPSEPYHFTEDHLPMFESLGVPVMLVDGSLLTWHGTRIAYAMDSIPALLCPASE
jgi:ABC-type Fe3+-hydroxamate transport system substrate-binding protein